MQRRLWRMVFAAIALLPVTLAIQAKLPWMMQLGVGFGYAALGLMTLEFLLVAKTPRVARAFGMDGLLWVHRWVGLSAGAFLVVHIVVLVVNGYPLEWLNPFGENATWAMRWGVVGLLAVVVILVSTMARRKLGLAYQRWLWLHGAMAKVLVAAAMAHVVLVRGEWPLLLIPYVCLLFGLTVYFEVWKPIRMWLEPWEVVSNRGENADTRTLGLQPIRKNRFDFSPGQFAWLSTELTPFGKDRHPISMCSAPGVLPVEFAVKALGDWSQQVVPQLQPGTLIWVDGPYGVFSPDLHEGPGLVLIGGGVGVTPLVSMCEALAARGDKRQVVFFYGAESQASLRFQERLKALQSRMNLLLVYTLEKPTPDWAGERGYLNLDMLRRHLPAQALEYQYFVCGPEAMMDAVDRMLRELGVQEDRLHTERFVMV